MTRTPLLYVAMAGLVLIPGAAAERPAQDHHIMRDPLRGLATAIDAQFERWHLTSAEREVALLILKGLSHKEIAEVRQTTERTIRQQAQAIYGKANLSGRAALSAFFLEDLLLPLESSASPLAVRSCARSRRNWPRGQFGMHRAPSWNIVSRAFACPPGTDAWSHALCRTVANARSKRLDSHRDLAGVLFQTEQQIDGFTNGVQTHRNHATIEQGDETAESPSQKASHHGSAAAVSHHFTE
ncbi:MAG: hypothetical protein GEU99_25990 [Luteitalea sp.]|nr:hypothetical protein [Luteitalea sp.]